MKTLQILVTLMAVALATNIHAQSPLRSGKDYAYFFYVNSFQDTKWDKLSETKQEVENIANELKTNYGFKSEVFPNFTKQQVLDKIAAINRQPFGPSDQVLFFFSTHGNYEPQQDEGFLIPVDGKYTDPYGDTWINYADLGRRIAVNGAGHVILAIDACYSGSFGIRNAKKGGNITPPWESQTTDCTIKHQRGMRYKCRLYFSSGSKEQRTPGRSLFARRWLETLRKGEEIGVVRKEDFDYYLGKIEFPEPEDGSFGNSNQHDDGGDFAFVHKNACGAAPVVPPVISPKKSDTPADPDGDNLTGTNDECPDEFGSAKAKGCPDYDDDGIPNKRDQCPYEAGTADRNGCPAPADSDGDGVPDAADKCKNTKGLPKYEGCPDSDGDLVPDHLDQCPEKKGKPEKDGCPDDDEDLPDFVRIQGGSFQMGSNDGDSDEKPTHQVTVSDFYIAVNELTFEEYDAYCNATSATKPSDSGWGRGKRPVINVDWYDAIRYCNWRSSSESLRPYYAISTNGNETKVNIIENANGYRLPTEAEWEFAARSRGKDEKWAGTNSESSLSTYGNYYEGGGKAGKDGYQYTSPVGSFRPNALGLNDMSGNVREWCNDWYDSSYYGSSPSRDPHGPDSGSYRVLRGGSWHNRPADLRCGSRDSNYPGYRNAGIGFRLARAAR